MAPRDLLLAACVPLIWSLGFVFAKAALNEFPPLMLMGMRFCLTALALAWFVPAPRGHFSSIFWIALVSATLQYGLTFTGLAHMEASLTIIIVQLEVPFGVLAAAVLLGERPGLQRMFGMVVAFAGIALIAGQPSFENQLFPMLLAGSGAMMWALGQVLVKRLGRAVGSFSLIAWVGVFAGPQMLIASLLLEDGQVEALQNASWVGWGAVLYLAFVMTALGYGIWYHVLTRNPMAMVMPVLLLLPVFTILFSVVLLGEHPGVTVLLGGLIVLVGLAIIVFTRAIPAAGKRSALE